MTKNLLLFFTIIFAASHLNFAQSYHEASFDEFDDWDHPFSFMDGSTPFIELNYGFSDVRHKNFGGDFAKTGLLELKLGYFENHDTWEDHITKTSSSFIFVSNVSTDLSSSESSGKVNSSLWRFGAGFRNGFGYHFNKFSIIPYNQCSFSWSRVDFDEINDGAVDLANSSATLSTVDYEILNRYDEAYRFGTLSEGGVRFGAADLISFDAGYEASVIFPRFLTWKQSGSFIIKLVGLEAIDQFVDDVFDSAPSAGPVVNFILKNAYSYGFYQLQRDNMSWPFGTETPLTYGTFKLGITFTF